MLASGVVATGSSATVRRAGNLGNIGSHEHKPLPLSLVLDGIGHSDRTLELIYDPREKVLDRRAAMINQKGKRFKPSRVITDVNRTAVTSANSSALYMFGDHFKWFHGRVRIGCEWAVLVA